MTFDQVVIAAIQQGWRLEHQTASAALFTASRRKKLGTLSHVIFAVLTVATLSLFAVFWILAALTTGRWEYKMALWVDNGVLHKVVTIDGIVAESGEMPL